ncbi:galactokinase family protein [Dubosiella muris]|uniref:Galactokinase n=2 Tax=Dubosiella TaxID=1937008 RepID=A0AC61R548_9FIRM|nr:galactokinase family protein [Dubosiella muris]TGY64418.1 galactokinase [Dubosiella muris]
MKTVKNLIDAFENNQYDDRLMTLYGDASRLDAERNRYVNALKTFERLYGDQPVQIFSAAGRSEVAGNHTDHQHGRVLAASINLDTIGIVAKTEQNVIKVVSDDFDIAPVDVNQTELETVEESSASLIRGVVQGFKNANWNVGGFEAYMTSEVIVGAGLSSSASFEVLVGTILSYLYNEGKVPMVEIAKIAQYAENKYFGKPCGLMDQCACAVGGLITIDFMDPKAPVVQAVDLNFDDFGLNLCIVDTKGSHADLTHEYAAVPAEMKAVANFFGKDVLRDVDVDAFYEQIPAVREQAGDRAVLRALHFFHENERVREIVQALEKEDKEGFERGILASGNSSFKYLQNVFAASDPANQAVSLALAISEEALEGKGVSRVHGGGFAGTIQAFVNTDDVQAYKEKMEKVFGEGSCHVLKIRPEGGTIVVE